MGDLADGKKQGKPPKLKLHGRRARCLELLYVRPSFLRVFPWSNPKKDRTVNLHFFNGDLLFNLFEDDYTSALYEAYVSYLFIAFDSCRYFRTNSATPIHFSEFCRPYERSLSCLGMYIKPTIHLIYVGISWCGWYSFLNMLV